MKEIKSPLPPGRGVGVRAYWSRWYLLVLIFLIIQIVFYYFITQYFN